MLLENSQAEHLEGGESQQKEAEREADQQLKVPLHVVFGSGIAGLEKHVTASDTGQSCNQVSALAFGTYSSPATSHLRHRLGHREVLQPSA